MSIPITIYYKDWDYHYDNWNTLGTKHDNALYLECNSREYREITDIGSDVEEVREVARGRIRELLNK